MSLSDMDDDLALAALLGRGPRTADETALAGVLGQVSALADGPAPVPSGGLAAFLAGQTAPPVVQLAPAAPARRSRRSLVRKLVPAGLAAKVVLGAAGVAVAGTTSIGAAALVGGDDLPPRRPAVVDPTPAVVSEPSTASQAGEGRRTTPAPTPAVEAHSDGRGSDDERASVRDGGTRAPQAERPATRPERPARETGRPVADMDDDRAGRPRDTASERPDPRPTAGSDRTPGASQREPRPEPSASEDSRASAPSGLERRRAPSSSGSAARRPAPGDQTTSDDVATPTDEATSTAE